jgi:hypothetical protein
MSTCCTPTRMYSPSPTVKASRVPLYQLGWLGDDGAGDPSLYDIQYGGGTPDYSPNPDFVATLTYPDPGTPSFWDMLQNPELIPTTPTSGAPRVYGPPAPGQAGSSVAPSVASSISSLFTSIFKPNAAGSQLAPGPAPRVSSTPTQASSVTGWIQQNLGLLAIGAVAVVAIPAIFGGRRR